jgi:hypothetical protein
MIKKFENYDYWNDIVKIIDNSENEEIKENGKILLKQINELGDEQLMKNELKKFIEENKELLKENVYGYQTIKDLNKTLFNKEKTDYMADSNIKVILQSAQYLDEIINRKIDNLPDWIEDKLSKCSNDMQSIHNYFKSLKSD